jgi:hypothetical protein
MKVLHQTNKDLEIKFAKEFEAHKRTQDGWQNQNYYIM